MGKEYGDLVGELLIFYSMWVGRVIGRSSSSLRNFYRLFFELFFLYRTRYGVRLDEEGDLGSSSFSGGDEIRREK